MITKSVSSGLLALVFLIGSCKSVDFTPTQTVAITVLKDHVQSWLERPAGSTDEYQTLFIDIPLTSESLELAALSRNGVRVAVGTNHLVNGPEGAVFDSRTMQRAVVFAAKIEYIDAQSATVRSWAYTGRLGAEFMKYRLVYKGGRWTIILKESDGYAQSIIDRQLAVFAPTGT